MISALNPEDRLSSIREFLLQDDQSTASFSGGWRGKTHLHPPIHCLLNEILSSPQDSARPIQSISPIIRTPSRICRLTYPSSLVCKLPVNNIKEILQWARLSDFARRSFWQYQNPRCISGIRRNGQVVVSREYSAA